VNWSDSKLFNDTKRRATYLRQLSFLFETQCRKWIFNKPRAVAWYLQHNILYCAEVLPVGNPETVLFCFNFFVLLQFINPQNKTFVKLFYVFKCYFNPLEFRGNYCSTSNFMKLVYRPLMGWLVQGTERGRSTKCNRLTAHSSTASVPITVLLYNGPLLRGINVSLKS